MMEEQNQQFWQLGAFARELNMHFTTINDWFNLLEERRVHYVSRRTPDGKRVFDELDRQVAEYIKRKREERWSLDAIVNTIGSEIETRPFPKDYQSEKDSQIALLENLRSKMMEEFESIIENKLQKIDQKMEKLQMDEANERQKERTKRINDFITENRIRMKLEIEALEEWMKKPKEERYEKVGLFRKAEKTYEKEKFIKEYVSNHFEERIKEEFGID